MKSKSTAYLLWLFIGIWGGHKFYLGKVGIGILYFFTFGFFFIGWFIDLFTLGTRVDNYNLLYSGQFGNRGNNTNVNNIMVNVPTNQPVAANEKDMVDQLHRLSDLKDKGILTQEEFDKQKAKILG